jgi:hypothetical protein
MFPFGTGMPERVSTMHEDAYYTRYLMMHHGNTFASDPRFSFFLFNVMQRHANLRGTSLKIKAQEKAVQAFGKITQSDTFMPRLEAALQNPKSPQAAKLIASIQPHISQSQACTVRGAQRLGGRRSTTCRLV